MIFKCLNCGRMSDDTYPVGCDNDTLHDFVTWDDEKTLFAESIANSIVNNGRETRGISRVEIDEEKENIVIRAHGPNGTVHVFFISTIGQYQLFVKILKNKFRIEFERANKFLGIKDIYVLR